MAEKVVIKAETREGRGKNESRRLRREGKIPIVVYGGGAESVAVSASIGELAAILRSESGHNTVFSLDIDGAGVSDVIFQDRQIDPLMGRLMHADLRRIAKGEKMELTVPIHLEGEPVGVKEDGGLLEQQLREIKVICEPANAPDAIIADVSELKMGESIHVSDLKVDRGIEIQELPESVVASVTFLKEPELEPQVEEGAEPEVEGETAGEPAEGENAE